MPEKVALPKFPSLSELNKKRKKTKAAVNQKVQKKSKQTSKNDSYIPKELRRILQLQYEHPNLTNRKISISLKSASIEDAIEIISKFASLNFVIDSDVSGEVKNLRLKDVPVAYALKAILSNNDPELALKRESGIYRVMLLDKVVLNLKEKFNELKRSKFVKASVTMQNIVFNKMIRDRLNKMWKSITGDAYKNDGVYMVLDDQTKKVFLHGREQHIEDMREYLKEIDVSLPQVKIEARVVIARKDFDESLGLQLSGVYNRRSSINHGIGLVGGGSLSNIKNDPTDSGITDWALNLFPDSGAKSRKINFPFVFGGKDLNTRRLNLVLSAAENRGELKTILKPSILTNHGDESTISVGDSLPIETVVKESIEGTLRDVTTVTYKDVGTILKVRPLVSPNKQSVSLDIFVENSSYVSHDKYPIISSAKTKCRVMLKNGQTGMIGGLIEKTKKKNNTTVPLLSDIPVVGNLFKGSHKEARDHQLLIFITPTVV